MILQIFADTSERERETSMLRENEHQSEMKYLRPENGQATTQNLVT